MNQETKSSKEKLNEALFLANEAIKEMGSDTKEIIFDEYTHLKDAVVASRIGKKLEQAKEYGTEKAKEVTDKAKEFGEEVDENVREKPYHFIAGAALVGLVLGVLVGRK